MRDPTKVPARQTRGHAPGGWLLIVAVGALTLSPVIAMFYGAISPGLLEERSGFTLDALRSVYTSPDVLRSLAVTFALAITVGLLSTIVGLALAWLIARTDVPAPGTMELIVISPILFSPLISALAWFTVASPRSGLLNVLLGGLLGHNVEFFNVTSLPGIVWVLVLHFEPYAYLLIVSALRNMDASLEEASFINGSGTFATLRRVTLPMTFPSIASACLFIIVLTAGEFSVPAVLGANLGYVPLPILIFRAVNGSIPDYPQAASLGTAHATGRTSPCGRHRHCRLRPRGGGIARACARLYGHDPVRNAGPVARCIHHAQCFDGFVLGRFPLRHDQYGGGRRVHHFDLHRADFRRGFRVEASRRP